MPQIIGILLWALVPGFIARSKGRSFWAYYFLSLLITPFITMIITLCLSNLKKQIPNDSHQDENQQTKICKCGKCDTQREDNSEPCRVCGSTMKRYEYVESSKISKYKCRKCGTELPLDSIFCHKCGTKVVIPDSNCGKDETENYLSNEKPLIETDTYKLASATVNIADKIAETNKDSSLAQNDLVSCDTALFCCFIVRAFCLTSAASREKAVEFSNDYINNFKEILNQKFCSLVPVLSDMFDNRAGFYDRIFASKNDAERKFRAVIEEFEYIIKTDIINNKYVPFSETSPLPILDIDADIKIRMEVMKLYNDLPKLVAPYFENVKSQLKR